MKKLIFALLSVMMVAAMTSCAGEAPVSSSQPLEESSSSIDNSQATQSAATVSSVASEEVSYAAMIPDPNEVFTNATITITDDDGGKAYIFNVTGYNDGEFDTFVTGCKDLGFTNVEYETTHDKGQDFGAYTEDGKYWVQVNLDSENEIIYVICQESKENS